MFLNYIYYKNRYIFCSIFFFALKKKNINNMDYYAIENAIAFFAKNC